MKAIINLDECDYHIYQSKEEWDADTHSYAGYRREYDAFNYKRGTPRYSGPLHHYQNEPDRYPCLMFIGNYMCQSSGPDEIANFFIYDFTLIEE